VKQGTKTYVALKRLAQVDREEQDNVAAGIVRFGENGGVLWLSCPDAL
jgi:hypothetical protein